MPAPVVLRSRRVERQTCNAPHGHAGVSRQMSTAINLTAASFGRLRGRWACLCIARCAGRRWIAGHVDSGLERGRREMNAQKWVIGCGRQRERRGRPLVCPIEHRRGDILSTLAILQTPTRTVSYPVCAPLIETHAFCRLAVYSIGAKQSHRRHAHLWLDIGWQRVASSDDGARDCPMRLQGAQRYAICAVRCLTVSPRADGQDPRPGYICVSLRSQGAAVHG